MTPDVVSQQPQHAVREPRAIATGLIGGALLGAVVLRWFHLGRLSLWWDEGYTAWASGLSLADIVEFARRDFSPPLYYVLEHCWVYLFGNAEYALRALSALFGTLSLPVFYLLAKEVLKDSMAVALAMWLFAFSIIQVWYSREARTYEVASFFSLLALYALILFLEKRSVTLFAIIVLSVTATLYMHNMMFFYLLALNVIWLTYPSERTWAQHVKEVLLADILAGVLYLPWVHTLLTQAVKIRGGFWIPRPTVSTLLHTLTVFSGFDPDYLRAVALRLLPLSYHTASVCVLGGVGFLCAAMVAGGLWRVPKEARSKNISLWVYCLLPIFAVFVLSRITRPLFIDRVFIDSSVVIPIVFAYPLAFQKGRKGRLLYGSLGIVLGAATALSGFGYLRYQEKEDWRGVTSCLLRIQESKRLIVFAPAWGEKVFNYYTQRLQATDLNIVRMGIPTRPKGPIMGLGDMTPLKLAVESRKYSEIDLVLAYEDSVDPDGLVFGYLNGTLTRHEEKRFFGVRIVRFLAPRGRFWPEPFRLPVQN